MEYTKGTLESSCLNLIFANVNFNLTSVKFHQNTEVLLKPFISYLNLLLNLIHCGPATNLAGRNGAISHFDFQVLSKNLST